MATTLTNVANVGTFSGTCSVVKKGPFKGQTGCSSGIPEFYNNTDVKATLSNNTGLWLLGKYALPSIPLTISGGYAWWRQANPSNDYLNGFQTIGGWNVPATIAAINKTVGKLFPTAWTNFTAYNDNRFVNVFFIGGKYAINPQLDVSAAFYYLDQNNYNSSTKPCANAPTRPSSNQTAQFQVTRINSGACAGATDFVSFLIDYRPVKRVDLYAGVMVSNVYGGLANGYQVTQTINPTAGLRIKF